MHYPQLLTFQQKYGDVRYLIESAEDIYAAALEILTDKASVNWYYFDEPIEDENELCVKKFDMGFDDLLKLEDQQIPGLKIAHYSSVKQAVDSVRSELAENKRNQLIKRNLEKAVEEKDGKLAWKILREFNGGEYDSFEFDRFENRKYEDSA